MQPEKSLVSQGLRRFFIEGGSYGTELLNRGHIGDEVYAGIRPEDIRVVNNGPLESEIEVYELLGAESYIYFQFQGKKMCAKVAADIPLQVGDKFHFTLMNDKIHFFDTYSGAMIM